MKTLIFIFYFVTSLAIAFSQTWNVGTGLTYSVLNTILLGENSKSDSINGTTKDVGFRLTAKLKVLPVWKDLANPDTVLISIKIESPQLYIKSRKAPEPEGFIEHTSHLANLPDNPIFLLWKNGQLLMLFASSSETVSSLNLKRSFANIFQYKTTNTLAQERDISGVCSVRYNFKSSNSFEKLKESCKRSKSKHPNPILGVNHKSSYVTTYELTDSLLPNEIIENEKHEMHLIANPGAKTSVFSYRLIKLLPNTFYDSPVAASSYIEAINKQGSQYVEVPIEAQNEQAACPETGCATLGSTLENVRSSLDASALGSAKSALAFLKIVPYIRDSTVDHLIKILKDPQYQDILPQLYDLYGSASTVAAHQAAMKILKDDDIGDNTERYLWALSMSPFPNPDILKDILRRSEETIDNDKISETLALTAAAMAKQYGSPNYIDKAKDSLELGLFSCSGEPCKIKFLRSLGNLGSKNAVPILLKFTNSSKAISVVTWKALSSFDSNCITPEVKTLAMKTFLQLKGQRVDSSARTLALNVILENNPSVDDLQQLLQYLNSQDTAYEVKKYLLQRLYQLDETKLEFHEKLKEATKRELVKNVNYNTLSQKGLSTAFTRSFLRSAGSNGSLVTIQEINSGLLKRGIVDVILESGEFKHKFFSLGLFADGLGSFMSSSEDEDNDVPSENEVATAGMEISFFNVYIRPFVFFSGQGELMGHVWSGTASERTPAFQTIVNLHRYKEVINLGSGFVVETDVEGAMSFDLAGQIQLSLWSRNAQSLVEMKAGVAIRGSSKILTSFVHSRAEFTVTVEPKLELATDIDFSGPVSLCMRLAQPETLVNHHVYKVERIPGSRHKLRKTRTIQSLSPAKSYLLNSKNNEMCTKIFN